jgi:hypothetical protein
MSQPGELSLAPSGLILAFGKAGSDPAKPDCSFSPLTCDDLELGIPTGFPKSRVYAKLLMRLISECYQTFNRQVEEVGPANA